jgi:hypothetical protein
MKKFFYAAIAACVAFLAASCEGKLEEPTGEVTGSLYGTWVFDTYKIALSGSVNEKDGSIPVVIPYVFKKTTLSFNDNSVATAHMGWETKMSKFTYNPDKRQIVFDKMLEVSDDGMVMILAGTFDVVELTEDKLVLKQPYVKYDDWVLPSGTTISTDANAWYTYHREAK